MIWFTTDKKDHDHDHKDDDKKYDVEAAGYKKDDYDSDGT